MTTKMTRFWKHDDDVERMLKAARPQPRQAFFRAAESLVESHSPRRAPLRVGLAVGVMAVFTASLAAFGAVGYAASAATSSAHAISAVFVSSHHSASLLTRHVAKGSKPSGGNVNVSSADVQYDKKVTLCHNGHTISVGLPAKPAHIAIGDTEGACP